MNERKQACSPWVWSHGHLITITVLGSFVFLGLPGFCHFFYVTERLNWSGVSAGEWVWALLIAVWVGVMFLLGPQKDRCFVLAREHTVFVAFLVVNAVWMIIPMMNSLRHREKWNLFTIVDVIGGKSAWPALWNVAILCIPIQRVSPVLASMGINSQQAVPFHIWAANATGIWLLVHTVFLSIVYVVRTDSAKEWFSLMLPYKWYYTEGVVNFMGWVGLFGFAGLWASSLPVVQRKFYEVFRVLHWVFNVFFLLGSNLHDYNTLFFVQPAIVLMIADFMLRRRARLREASPDEPPVSSYTRRSDEGTVRISTHGSLASLTFPIPDSWPSHALEEPGLHVYLTIPHLTKWQSHPFSVSQINPKDRTFSIHVKDLGDWSRDLVDSARSVHGERSMAWEIEGPYASPALYQTIQSHKHCIFLAGGVGLTGVAALAKARLQEQAARQHPGNEYDGDGDSSSLDTAHTTTLLWMVQTESEAGFLLPLLRDCQSGGNLHAHAWITRSNPDDPDASLFDAEAGGRPSSPVATASVRARWGFGTRFHTGTVLSAALLSSAVALVLSRWICGMQPSAGDIPHARECYWLGRTTTCRYCETEDTLAKNNNITDPDQLPCCTTPVCQYCFRGLPMVLAFGLTPLLTILLVRAFHAVWLRSCGRFGYASIDSHDETEPQQQHQPHGSYSRSSSTTTFDEDDEEDSSGGV